MWLIFLDWRFILFFGMFSWFVMWLADNMANQPLFFGKHFVKGRGLPFFLLSIFLMPLAFIGAIFALLRWATHQA